MFRLLLLLLTSLAATDFLERGDVSGKNQAIGQRLGEGEKDGFYGWVMRRRKKPLGSVAISMGIACRNVGSTTG